MRIGITCHPSAGGSGILATELGMALAERGHTIHFVTMGTPFRLRGYHENIVCHAVDAATYPLFNTPPNTLALASRICEVAEEHAIEVWHAHYAIPNAAAAILAREMLPPKKRFCIATTLHGTDITLVGSDPSFYRVTQFAMERSCAVTAVSHWLADETRREFSLDKPVRVIHNFFNPDKFHPRPEKPCRLCKGGAKVVMHISNFRPVKRVTDVIRIFKRIADTMDARLVMVGEGPERLSAVGVAKQLGIQDKIQYLGNHEEIETLLPCADLILQPSEHESFGLVPLEAMACGVPVVATGSGGITEVIENGTTGWLCEVGDIDTMATRSIALLENPAAAQEMGRLGHTRANDLFHRDTIVAQYEALYQELHEMRARGIAHA